ncbi:hypothetical protein SD22575_2129 [Shigella dysenteriae 225-75]|nr:hypothetical protein SD22575_2129 [Shigella dysenteriae 225-75]
MRTFEFCNNEPPTVSAAISSSSVASWLAASMALRSNWLILASAVMTPTY